ncbi:HDOD domain-containing protein [Pseudomonas sp. dw_358]|uniref:HDOD domain-containing protein n=1 Tax=Pseudomonas sp. dw_358 TaxID=2720083 RepID=UPI001BD222F1|nr:HDOD domain-containing protein [Pseudomonas sp. dw_358]
MSELAEVVQKDLLTAIDKDDLVLPTLPEVALAIREAAEDSEISVSQLSRVIGRDAALAARLIQVVNSPLLRATVEVTDLHTAITRLGVNYSCNLAIGLVIEQIFHARSSVVEHKMREVWQQSQEIAGISYEICRRFDGLEPDQGALAGLIHQIGVLPILTYAQDNNELLSDPVCLNHVIDAIHPVIGAKILRKWEFPLALAKVPGQYLDRERESPRADYGDVVQVATLLNQRGRDPVLGISDLPAYRQLRMHSRAPMTEEQLQAARDMFC